MPEMVRWSVCLYILFFSGSSGVFLTADCMLMKLYISLYILFFSRGNKNKEIQMTDGFPEVFCYFIFRIVPLPCSVRK